MKIGNHDGILNKIYSPAFSLERGGATTAMRPTYTPLFCRFTVFFRIVEICCLQFPLIERQSLYGFFSTFFSGDIPFYKLRDKSIWSHSLPQSLLGDFLLEFWSEVDKQFSQVRNIFQILERLIILAPLHKVFNNILFCQRNRFPGRQPSINRFFR